MPPTTAQRQKIHIAKKELGITDEIYRDILSFNFKVKSSSNLSPFQADKLLEIFKAKGWKARSSKKMSPKYDDPQHRKIVAMWITMAKAKVIRNSSDRALQAYVKRVTHIDNLKWCDGADCHILIESLKAWGLREGVDFTERELR